MFVGWAWSLLCAECALLHSHPSCGWEGSPLLSTPLDFTDWGSRRRKGLLTVTQLVGPGRPQPAPSPVQSWWLGSSRCGYQEKGRLWGLICRLAWGPNGLRSWIPSRPGSSSCSLWRDPGQGPAWLCTLVSSVIQGSHQIVQPWCISGEGWSIYRWENEAQGGDRRAWGPGHSQAYRLSHESVVSSQGRKLQGLMASKPSFSSFLLRALQSPLPRVHNSTPAECVWRQGPFLSTPELWLGHKSWTMTRQRDKDESAGCHGNLVGCWDPGEGLGCVPEPRHLDNL